MNVLLAQLLFGLLIQKPQRMKTTVSINMGGLAFYVDEDAYAVLQKYFRRVEANYSKEQGCEEITADIETRVAELFRERVGDYKQVIMLSDVVEVIGIMGDPEDFENAKSDARTSIIHTGHNRIYRDVDNRYIAGVCSGLAAYWSIDVVFIRVIFGLFLFIGGVSLIVYPILWIVLPPALTTAQKIEMRGEPVNIDNIKKTVRSEFDKVKESLKRK